MPVRELLARISSRELSEWMAYYELEPWGEERADLRAGIVASTVANVARDPAKRKDPFRPEEFVPRFDQERESGTGRQTWQEQLAIVEMLNVALGGVDKRDDAGEAGR